MIAMHAENDNFELCSGGFRRFAFKSTNQDESSETRDDYQIHSTNVGLYITEGWKVAPGPPNCTLPSLDVINR
jgi:hypothetical protein